MDLASPTTLKECTITNHVLMVRPAQFRMNEQTAVNNYFQNRVNLTDEEVLQEALSAFDAFVTELRKHGVKVLVIQDDEGADTPDAIYPNNWMSVHADHSMVLYPMFAENRRLERRSDIVEVLQAAGCDIKRVVDLSSAEASGRFMEGTGSLVLDRTNRIAYCALSPRADESLLQEFCDLMGYHAVAFTAMQTVGSERARIYHTNVMMCIAETFAVVCLECIDDPTERKALELSIINSGKQIIAISEEQVSKFAGNMLQVVGTDEQRFLVMSDAAYSSLTSEQLAIINDQCGIIHSSLAVIEACGGGSARCMLAEIY